MNVKMEGKNLQLLGDPMLKNHGPSGSPANAATLMGVIQASGWRLTAVTGEKVQSGSFGHGEGTASILGALGLSLLASGCSSGRHAQEGRPYLAQTMAVDCKPGESSVVCCIKKWGPGSCGFNASEAADLLNGARVLNEAAKAAADGAEAKSEVAVEEDDPDEGWKQHCLCTRTGKVR
jgi:hypothetical protein